MGDKDADEKKKKNPVAPKLAGKRRKKKGPAASVKIPQIFPTSKCKLRLLKLERVKDFLLMEQEFIQNQEIRRPREEQNEVLSRCFCECHDAPSLLPPFPPSPLPRRRRRRTRWKRSAARP